MYVVVASFELTFIASQLAKLDYEACIEQRYYFCVSL